MVGSESEGFLSAGLVSAVAPVARLAATDLNTLVALGTLAAWLAAAGIYATSLEDESDGLARRGRTPSFVAVGGMLAGLVAIADRPTDAARGAVAAMKAQGLRVAMVSGDRRATAGSVPVLVSSLRLRRFGGNGC